MSLVVAAFAAPLSLGGSSPSHAFSVPRKPFPPTRPRPQLSRPSRSPALLPAMSAARPRGEGLTYAASGVDIDNEAASVKALIAGLSSRPPARRAGTLGASVPHPGGFSGLIEFGDSLLAMCTDGVGSKLLLASELGHYDSIALDCVAMNVNDLLCVGAEPLAFVDYIAAPRPDPSTWAALGRSLAEACARARVSLCGGESASLPDMVSHLDMSGTALGSVRRGLQLDGSSVRSGDALVGLPSSGVHSNGYSLVRRVVAASGARLDAAAPFEVAAPTRADAIWRFGEGGEAAAAAGVVTLGEVLLNPTRIYVDPVVDLLKACRDGEGPCAYDEVHGIVHVTGGGLSNFLRLRAGVGFEIDAGLPVLPEFEWLQRAGDVSDFEMWRTFNMGMGMCVVVEAESAGRVAEWVAARLPGTQVVGRVTEEAGVVRHAASGVTLDRY